MEVTLKFTQEEMQILSKALIQLPYIEVVELINNINVQVSKQLEQNKNEK